MSGNESENENELSMEENQQQQQQELDFSVSPATTMVSKKRPNDDDIDLDSDYDVRQKKKRSMAPPNKDEKLFDPVNENENENKLSMEENQQQQEQNLQATSYACETLQRERENVLAAVKKNGWALQYASELLRGDRDIVLAAVKQNGMAFEFATETLKGDREVVLTAVKENGLALQFATETLKGDSNSLKADKEVVLAAVRNNCNALKYANDALKQDRDCLIAAGIWDENYPVPSTRCSFIRSNIVSIDFILSTRYSLGEDSRSIATEFTRVLNKNKYNKDKNFKIFSPNAYCKSTCDPEWTRMSWPCRGTFESCKFGDHLKTGEPHDGCCWRYSFRWHLEEAKKRNGIMLQVVDRVWMKVNKPEPIHELGDGQKIEKLMAEEIGIKVFRFYEPAEWGYDPYKVGYVHGLVVDILIWYRDGCKDMTPCEVKPY